MCKNLRLLAYSAQVNTLFDIAQANETLSQKDVYYHVYYKFWLMLVFLERLAFQEKKVEKNGKISYLIIGRYS